MLQNFKPTAVPQYFLQNALLESVLQQQILKGAKEIPEVHKCPLRYMILHDM